MQWIKKWGLFWLWLLIDADRFWDQYYPGGTYDPKVRISQAQQTPLKKQASAPKISSATTRKNEVEKVVAAAKVRPAPSKAAAAAAGPRDLVDEYQKIANDLTHQVLLLYH